MVKILAILFANCLQFVVSSVKTSLVEQRYILLYIPMSSVCNLYTMHTAIFPQSTAAASHSSHG
jgi:hypothetical protein